jgi:hypothetical protein
MPHIDELLGVATVAATGLLAAVLLQPARVGATGNLAVGSQVPAMTVEVVARRNPEQHQRVARERAGSDAGRPDA